MALKKALVIGTTGQIQQLQTGDTLDLSGQDQLSQTNDEATAIVIGCPVYSDAADGVKRAKADAVGTKDAWGLVAVSPSIANGVAGAIQYQGVLMASTAQWDAVTGDTGGLTFRQRYWLDPATAGKITKTCPTTVGQYVVELGIAISTTEFNIAIQQPILL